MNDRGSITVFSLMVMMALLVIFGLYMYKLVEGVEYNKALRVVENASRNIEASYDAELFRDYGLLAYKEDVLTIELNESIDDSLRTRDNQSLFPFAIRQSYSFAYTKKSDIMDIEETLKQMSAQALMNVPAEFIANQEGIQNTFEKAKAAKEKVKVLEAHSKTLESIKSINDDLGSVLDGFKEANEMIDYTVSYSGNLNLDSSELSRDIRKIEEGLGEMLSDIKSISVSIEQEKLLLELEEDKYPESFVESISKQLDDMLVDSSSVFSGELDIDGLRVNDMFIDHQRSVLERYAGDKSLVDELMSKYGYGLASLMQVNADMSEMEDELQSEYEDVLDDLSELPRDIARDIKKDIKNEIEEELESYFEDIELDINIDDMYDSRNRELERYADSILEHEFLQTSEEVEDLHDAKLSKRKIPDRIHDKLPSRTNKSIGIINSGIYRAQLTEYIMGTFVHRLSRSQEENWNFYNKIDRPSYFADGEIEYIIIGSDSEWLNRIGVATEIYLLREAANILHVYTSKEKMKYANDVSVAVAWPPWLKPVVFNGLLIGWASIESGVDLSKLLDGEKVPTFKLSDEDWFTSIDGLKESASSEEVVEAITLTDPSESQEEIKKSDSSSVASNTSDSNDAYDETAGKNPAYATNSNSTKDTDSLKNSKAESQANEQGYTFYLRILLNLNIVGVDKHVLRSLDIIALNNMDSFDDPQEVPDLESYWTGHEVDLVWDRGSVKYSGSY